MKHLAAYMLLQLAGNASPTEEQIAKLMKDSGVSADKEELKTMCEKMKGKKTHDLVAEGRGKFASMPAGGGAPSGGSAPATSAPAGGKKEEEKKPEEEEDDGLD